MRLVSVCALLVSTLFLVACSTVKMTSNEESLSDAQNTGLATIIFLRSSPFNKKEIASIYEVIDGDLKFIGVLQNDTRISYKASPGKHVFMVYSVSVEYMKAEVKEGLTYYSMISPGIGGSTKRFFMWPVRKGISVDFYTESRDFPYWLSSTKPVVNNKKTIQWFAENRLKLKDMHDSIWPIWKQAPAHEIDRHTLHAKDGM